jgi:uncharacterized membrane protein (UPF0127 family)
MGASLLCVALLSIEVGGFPAEVEVAKSAEEKRVGLSGREEIVRGMLFVYEREEPLSFWMKGTLAPLTIAFFNRERELLETKELMVPEPGSPLPVTRSSSPASYALEMPQGWFSDRGIEPGAKLSLLNGEDEVE